MYKKGKSEFGGIISLVLVFGLIIFVISFSAFVLGNIKSTQTANSTEYNTTTNALAGLSGISKLFSPMGILVATVIIIILIFTIFQVAKKFN